MRYDSYCSHKPYSTSEPPFSSTKGYLTSIMSISKLQYIQQINNSLLIILLTTILPLPLCTHNFTNGDLTNGNTSEPPFSYTKGYLPSITSISKLQSIQQINNSLLLMLLTTILLIPLCTHNFTNDNLNNGNTLAYQFPS